MIRGADALNGSAFALALALSAWGANIRSGRDALRANRGPELVSAITPETLADGTRVLRDADGVAVALKAYGRIASGTIVADRVLVDLCEPSRIVAFTDYGSERSVSAHRLSGKPGLSPRAPVEAVLALKPDLLLVSNLVDPAYTAQLREHGVAVFDLGHMRGAETLFSNVRAIGWLIGAPERAEGYARSLSERLARIAPHPEPRKSGLYISIYGDKLYGGGAHTSYHDVLEYAGLTDAAADAGLDGWPELSAERVLSFDPDVLLTKTGMGAVFCRHSGLADMRVCRGDAHMVELDGALLDDPGPAILDAAEALYGALHAGEPL